MKKSRRISGVGPEHNVVARDTFSEAEGKQWNYKRYVLFILKAVKVYVECAARSTCSIWQTSPGLQFFSPGTVTPILLTLNYCVNNIVHRLLQLFFYRVVSVYLFGIGRDGFHITSLFQILLLQLKNLSVRDTRENSVALSEGWNSLSYNSILQLCWKNSFR